MEIRNIQLIELDILKEIDRICKKNGIEYWLDGGTALGAIRHKGFIPWDDDIDVGMTRDNYEKFLEIAKKELRSNYFLQNIETEVNCPQLYTKIKKNNTLYISWACRKLNIHQGIYVDIFPYDYCLNDKNDKKLIKKYVFLNKIFTYKVIPDRAKLPEKSLKWIIGSIFRRLLYYVLFLFPKKILLNKIQEIVNKLKSKNGSFLVSLTQEAILFKENEIKPLNYIEFEKIKFPVPNNVDKYLTQLYGNYMKLPPVDERKGHPIYKYSILKGSINEK